MWTVVGVGLVVVRSATSVVTLLQITLPLF